MQTTPNAMPGQGWSEVLQDPLTQDITGGQRLPAFDQFDELANGQTVRANRVPRLAPRRPGLFRRLHTAARRLWLEWLLFDLGKQLDRLQDELAALALDAQAAARSHRHRPQLAARRREARKQYARLVERTLAVRQELDNLAVQ